MHFPALSAEISFSAFSVGELEAATGNLRDDWRRRNGQPN